MRVKDIKEEARDVRTFTLDIPPEFKPGQHILLTKDGISRPYSISSSPTENETRITVKRYDDGELTPRLFDLEEGQEIEVEGPLGNPFRERQRITFVCAGTGITPARSMLKYVLDKKLNIKIDLFYISRYKEDIIFHDELLEAEKKDNVRLFLSLTRPEEEWDRLKGRITAGYVKQRSPNSTYFVYGPPQMVAEMKQKLGASGEERP
ncbi:MAG: ferredoxin--NADP reductase [Nanobdellota archaeon]